MKGTVGCGAVPRAQYGQIKRAVGSPKGRTEGAVQGAVHDPLLTPGKVLMTDCSGWRELMECAATQRPWDLAVAH